MFMLRSYWVLLNIQVDPALGNNRSGTRCVEFKMFGTICDVCGCAQEWLPCDIGFDVRTHSNRQRGILLEPILEMPSILEKMEHRIVVFFGAGESPSHTFAASVHSIVLHNPEIACGYRAVGHSIRCIRRSKTSIDARVGNSLAYKQAGSRIRTDDLLITNQLLYQLSYAGKYCHSGSERRKVAQPFNPNKKR